MASAGKQTKQDGPTPSGKGSASTLPHFMNLLYFQLLSGPLAFLLIYLMPITGLPYSAQVVLATFAWAVVWWLLQPVPLGITALLPVVIFPFFGLMNASAVATLYGQSILFWLMGMALLAWGMEKHGLAKRVALGFLSLKGLATTTHRVAFAYMLVTGLISMFISDIATIAMALPIGTSIASYVHSVAPQRPEQNGRSPFATFLALGTLYAAVAGGMGTIAGVPFNAISVTILQATTGKTIGWFEWMSRGVPLCFLLLVGFYFLLRLLFPPEIRQIPGGEAFVRNEARKLGKLSRAEANVLAAFLVMIALFVIGPVTSLVLGTNHPLSAWLNKVLEFWNVPPVVLFLLFLLPVNIRKREFTLSWKEAVEHVPWSIILLTLSATAMLESLARFGFLNFMETTLGGFQIHTGTLPLLALMFGFVTNFVSAIAFTTLAAGIFIPAAFQAGFDTVTMTMLIPNVAIGIAWPWAGPVSITAFASGKITVKDMIKAGIPATFVMIVIVTLVHMAFLSFQSR